MELIDAPPDNSIVEERPKRPKTGGRRKGVPNKASGAREARIAREGLTPIDFMLSVLRDESHPIQLRMTAAKDVAPYVHPRLAQVEHSGPKGGNIVVQLTGADQQL